MWMCHHWFMHIETPPYLGRSHTRASTIDILIHHSHHIRCTNDMAIISYSPPKDGPKPQRQQLCILSKYCVSHVPHAPWWTLSWKVPRVDPQFVKNKVRLNFCNKLVWWVGHLSPKCILVGPTISLIIRINGWAMQLIKLPFPRSNSWCKSRCWERK